MPSDAGGNALLAELSAIDLSLVDDHLEAVAFTRGTALFRANRSTTHVYFPETAVIALRGHLPGGETVHVATTGREGFAGLHVFLETRPSSLTAVVQIPGSARRLESRRFRGLVRNSVGLRRLMHRYTDAFMVDVATTATCNAMHRVSERCARWLLAARDRVGSDSFHLSNQSLATMLGVHAAAITVVLRQWEVNGCARRRRSHVDILDPAQLAAASCSCYAAARERFAGLRAARQ